MKNKKKPTIAQMKKRPSLWWDDRLNIICLIYHANAIAFFDFDMGKEWEKCGGTMESHHRAYEFVGWL